MKPRTFLTQVEELAINLINEDYTITVDGKTRTYNLINKGWVFELNDLKYASGQCRYGALSFFRNGGTIMLSEFLILRINEGLEWWKHVILHEIAHALDVETRGGSAHDKVWQNICDQIGCDGSERSHKGFLPDVELPFLIYCPKCGWEERVPEVMADIITQGSSCGNCSPNKKFSYNHLIQWKKVE